MHRGFPCRARLLLASLLAVGLGSAAPAPAQTRARGVYVDAPIGAELEAVGDKLQSMGLHVAEDVRLLEEPASEDREAAY